MSTNNFVVKASINDVYLKPKNKYRIPRFQRQYTWEEKQIEEFWETIISDIPTFLGTIIFDVKEKQTKNIIEIVDGQQRYLSIQILGAVVRDLVIAYGKAEKSQTYTDQANGFNILIIGSPDDFDKTLFDNYLIPGDSIKDFFQKYIQKNPSELITPELRVPKDSEQEKVKKAYLKFRDFIIKEIDEFNFQEKCEWLKDLIRNKLSRHFFVKIEIEDEGLAYEIFETVNAKGVDLSVADLIKNQIFKNVVGPDDKHLDSAREKWGQIIETLSDNEFTLKDFISYYWSSRYRYISDKKLYNSIKDKFGNNKSNWNHFLDDLVINSSYLSLILNGSFEDVLEFFKNDRNEGIRVYQSLRVLRSTKAKTWIILYLCLFRNLDSQRDKYTIPLQLSKRWDIIQKFSFLYFQILNMPGNWYFKLICDFCEKIEICVNEKKDKAYFTKIFKDDFFKGFNSKIPNYLTFNEGFKSIQYKEDSKSRVVIRYVLNELEEKIGGNTNEGYNEEKVSIEHILPRNPRNWKVAKKAIKPFVNSLGNLTLINKNINGELGDKIIEEKIKIIKDKPSNLKLVQELVEKHNTKEWDFDRIRTDKNFEAIESRLEYLSKYAHQIWCDDLKKKMGF